MLFSPLFIPCLLIPIFPRLIDSSRYLALIGVGPMFDFLFPTLPSLFLRLDRSDWSRVVQGVFPLTSQGCCNMWNELPQINGGCFDGIAGKIKIRDRIRQLGERREKKFTYDR